MVSTPQSSDGNAIEQEAAHEEGVPERAPDGLGRRMFRRRRGGADAERPHGEHDGEGRDRGEDDSPPEQRRSRSDDGAEQRSEDGGAEPGPDQLPATLARRRREQPREGAGPGEAAAAALYEARRGERPEAVDEGEREARQPHQRQADEDRTPGAESRRDDAARQSADERSGRVGGDKHTRARLREVEVVGDPREERRERRVEHRVDRDERADEDEETAHWRSAYVRPTVSV